MFSAQTNSKLYKKGKDTTTAAFDTVIVFGEGPIKPVLLREELTSEQKAKWEAFQNDRAHIQEPSFFVIEKETSLLKLTSIEQNTLLSQGEKNTRLEEVRTSWQHNGWIALKRMGRQNALAAGYALFKGITERVILSGGKTISVWAKDTLSQNRLESWPSEASLMKDLIERTYGVLYEKKYGKKIDAAIVIEDRATNTLENFAFTINTYPAIVSEEHRVGFISARHHLKRIEVLAKLFSIHQEQESHLAAQELLHAAIYQDKQAYGDNFDFIADEQNYSETKEQFTREACWIQALEDPNYLTYWLGYAAEVKPPVVLQKIFIRLGHPSWSKKAERVFRQLGLHNDELTAERLDLLYQNNRERYFAILETLKELKKPEFRKLPHSPIPVPVQTAVYQ